MIDNHHIIYNFLRWRRVIFFLSIFLLLISCITVMIRGFNWGLDFTGGLIIEVSLEKDVDTINIRDALIQSGFKKVIVQHFRNSQDIMIRLPLFKNNNETYQNTRRNILNILYKNITHEFIIKQINWIGPSINNNLITTGIMAVLTALICILVYITFRFEWRLATGVVVSLIHDIIIIIGILSLFAIEIDSTIVAALMSAIGYSLNDNIVIFDRIRENFLRMFSSNHNAMDIFNISLSQVLNRTIITSMTTIMVLLVLLIYGGDMLHGFAITLLLGVVIGTISSVYVASSLAFKLGTKREHFIKKIMN